MAIFVPLHFKMTYFVVPENLSFGIGSANAEEVSKGRKTKVMLLQGPVGPFFSQLQNALEAQNIDVVRVCLNSGDAIFSKRSGRLIYSGVAEEWESWIGAQLSKGEIDCIIMFGSERYAHKIARDVAIEKGVRVIALEEGYVRPGYVTIEEFGNNAKSPLAGRVPDPDYIPLESAAPIEVKDGFFRMCSFGAIYFTGRGVLSLGKRRKLFHRDVKLVPDLFYWMRNAFRRALSAKPDMKTIEKLATDWDKMFYLVPLQVSKDSNIKYSGQGWSSKRLISESVASFSKTAPAGTRLVFKIHPMERGHNNLNPVIRSEAAAFGVSERVDIIETGPLATLTKHCRGMITINSTSGLSAIFHGVPLLVLGRAVYSNAKLAICSKNGSAFNDFWTSNHVADAKLRHSFLSWIKDLALKPGDFYSKNGSKVACDSVLQKLREIGLLHTR